MAKDYKLIQGDDTISKDLLDFLALFNVPHQGTLESVNQAMQDHLIRKPEKERSDLQDNQDANKLRETTLELLSNMGFVKPIAIPEKPKK